MSVMHVDVEAIVRSKKPQLHRWVPRFVFSLLRRLIREKEINEVLDCLEGKQDVPFISGVLDYLQIRREYQGVDHLKGAERFILASNHPLGGVDGLALAEAVDRLCGRGVQVVVNDILMNLTPLAGIFVPINKFGTQSITYARHLNEVLEGDTPMIYFPAGLCSRKIGGIVTDLSWKKTFVNKAMATGRDIIPAFVDECNSAWFYRLANWRKRLKIKANVEMLLLPGELFNRKGKRIRIVFGEPISHADLLSKGYSETEWTEILRQRCYALAEK